MRRAPALATLLIACWAASAAAQDASTPSAPAPTAPNAPAPSPPLATEAAPSAPPANLQTLAAADARAILGKKVSGTAGEDMGLVVDVLFDANKEPRAVVIDFGGFLGVGTRKIAVDWRLLQFYAPDSKTPLKLDLSRADVQSAREYKPDDKSISVIAGPGHVAPAATPPTETPPAPSEGTPSEPAPPAASAPPLPPAPAADEP
jgi:PRC-barrel domain